MLPNNKISSPNIVLTFFLQIIELMGIGSVMLTGPKPMMLPYKITARH